MEKIEKAYKRHCEVTCPVMQMDAELEQDEAQDFELEMLEEQGEEPGCDSECMKLLTTVARETVFTDPEQYDPQELAEPEEMDLKSVSDKQELVKLLETPAAPEKSSEKNIGREYMPSSLHEALELPGDLFNSLFRLCCRLRTASGGIDKEWINNARHVRRASPKLNWYQFLGIHLSKGSIKFCIL